MDRARTLAVVAGLLFGLCHVKAGPLTQDAPGGVPVPAVAAAYAARFSSTTLDDIAVSFPLAVDVYDLLAVAASSSIHRTGISQANAPDLFPLGDSPAPRPSASNALSANLVSNAAFNMVAGAGSSTDAGYTYKLRDGVVLDPESAELDESLDPFGLGLIVVLCAGAAWFGWRRREGITPQPRSRRRRLDPDAFLLPDPARRVTSNQRRF
jgi:hypothetical protein